MQPCIPVRDRYVCSEMRDRYRIVACGNVAEFDRLRCRRDSCRVNKDGVFLLECGCPDYRRNTVRPDHDAVQPLNGAVLQDFGGTR